MSHALVMLPQGMRFCEFCQTEHPLVPEFWLRLDSYPSCKKRKYAKAKEWSDANKDKHKKLQLDWRNVNLEECRRKSREYGRDHRQEQTAYRVNRYNTNLEFRLASTLRSRLCDAVRNNQKSGSAIRDLGCSIQELKQYLESQFEPGMSWDNYGKSTATQRKWNIDHLIPLANYQLSDRGTLRRLCHYTNLAPMWDDENLLKRNHER